MYSQFMMHGQKDVKLTFCNFTVHTIKGII